jgi:hypothetical protein
MLRAFGPASDFVMIHPSDFVLLIGKYGKHKILVGIVDEVNTDGLRIVITTEGFGLMNSFFDYDNWDISLYSEEKYQTEMALRTIASLSNQ